MFRRALPIVLLLVVARSAAAAEEEKKGEEKKEEKAESRVQLNVEAVIGAGKMDALNPDPASTVGGGQLRYVRAPTDVTAAGIVLSGRYDITKSFNLGLRFPVAVASLRPDTDTARGTANLGNIELEAEYEREFGEHVTAFVGGHVALPTSSGSELPSDAELAGNQAGIDPVSPDKYVVNKAVSSVYGDETPALWLAGYAGLVPVIGMKLNFGRVRIEPYVKAEAMFSIRPNAQESTIV